MYAGFIQSPIVAVIPQRSVICTLGHLLTINGTEQPIVRSPAPVFQILRKNFYHVLIERNNQGLSILCGIDIHDVIIKIHILDFDVDKAVLPDTGGEKKIDNYPTAICHKAALSYIRLS